MRDLRISTRVFDEISYACDGQSVVLSVGDGNISSTNASGVAIPSGTGLPIHTGNSDIFQFQKSLMKTGLFLWYLYLLIYVWFRYIRKRGWIDGTGKNGTSGHWKCCSWTWKYRSGKQFVMIWISVIRIQNLLIIYNSKPNLLYFLGQCQSSYGLPSSYVSQCKACGIKQLHSMWASCNLDTTSNQHYIHEATYSYPWFNLCWLFQFSSIGKNLMKIFSLKLILRGKNCLKSLKSNK